MAGNEIFASAARSGGDLAGVFEYDGETGYFYLYETEGAHGHKVISAIRVVTGEKDFGEQDISIQWSGNESKVGLFIRKQLWAAFDGKTGDKYGGNYCADDRASIPMEIISAFKNVS